MLLANGRDLGGGCPHCTWTPFQRAKEKLAWAGRNGNTRGTSRASSAHPAQKVGDEALRHFGLARLSSLTELDLHETAAPGHIAIHAPARARVICERPGRSRVIGSPLFLSGWSNCLPRHSAGFFLVESTVAAPKGQSTLIFSPLRNNITFSSLPFAAHITLLCTAFSSPISCCLDFFRSGFGLGFPHSRPFSAFRKHHSKPSSAESQTLSFFLSLSRLKAPFFVHFRASTSTPTPALPTSSHAIVGISVHPGIRRLVLHQPVRVSPVRYSPQPRSTSASPYYCVLHDAASTRPERRLSPRALRIESFTHPLVRLSTHPSIIFFCHSCCRHNPSASIRLVQ